MQDNDSESYPEDQSDMISGLIEHDVHVIPLSPKSKKPEKVGWRGSTPMSTKGALDWVERGGGLGAVLGTYSEKLGGFLNCIDLDIRDPDYEKEAVAKLKELVGNISRFPTVVTGHEDGLSRHLYFISTFRINKRILAKSDEFVDDKKGQKRCYQIELLAHGQFVVLPPSIHPDSLKKYWWLKPPCLEFGVPELHFDEVEHHEVQKSTEPLYISFERIREVLTILAECNFDYWVEDREGWLKIGMALHHETNGDQEGLEIWNEHSRPSKKYDQKDQEKCWKSFNSNRRNSKVVTFRSLEDEVHNFELKQEFDPLDHENSLNESHYGLLSAAECNGLSSRKYLVKGLIAQGDIVCVFGDPAAGKSLLGPYIAYMIAQGQEVFGKRTVQGKAFYIPAEDQSGMEARTHALRERYEDAKVFYIVRNIQNLTDPNGPDAKALIELIKEHRPIFIVIDTIFEAFSGLDILLPEDSGKMLKFARWLTNLGCTVMLIHHQAKTGGDTPFGSVNLNRAFDVTMRLTRNGENVKVRLHKNRNGPTGEEFAFRISTEKLGTDEDGDDVTAAYVEEMQGSGAKNIHLGKHADDVLNTLVGKMAVADWRQQYIIEYGGKVTNGALRKRFSTALKTLVPEHVIEEEGLYRRKDLVLAEDFDDDFFD